MEDIVPTVAALVFKDNEVLLVRHKEAAGHLTDTYGLPSGRTQEKEDDKHAAVRELKEETGLIIEKDHLVEFPENLYYASIERKGGEVVNFSWKVFLAKQFSGELEESEETKPEWVNIDDIGSLKLLPNVYQAVQDGLKFLQK